MDYGSIYLVVHVRCAVVSHLSLLWLGDHVVATSLLVWPSSQIITPLHVVSMPQYDSDFFVLGF